MGDELDFDATPAKGRSAKQGRRAQGKTINPPDAPAFEPTEQGSPQISNSRKAVQEDLDSGPPRRPSRVSGWGEDAPRKSRKLGEGFEQFEDDVLFGIDDKFGERLRPKSPERDDDSDNEIPVIPDLEDQQDDDIGMKVAIAPNVAVNRVATYRELDNDLLRQAAFLTLDNEIDLKLLTKSLATEADLIEEDKPWDWDRLFTEVTSELLSQTETSDEVSDPNDQSALPV